MYNNQYLPELSRPAGLKMLWLCTALLGLLFCSSLPAKSERKIETIATSDIAKSDRQRSIVAQLAKENFGNVRLQGNLSDLDYLQKIVDRGLINQSDTYDLQALGIILGDVMVRNLGLTWVVVDDRYGRSRALRLGDSDNLFFPVTMISRRVQAKLPVDVRQLYQETADEVKTLRERYNKYPRLPRPKYQNSL